LIYPTSFEHKIGFSQIREMLNRNCLSDLGRNFVEKMRFSSSFVQVEKLLKQTEEMRQILLFGKPFPAQDYHDLTHELYRLRAEGSYIEAENLQALKLTLQTISQCIIYLRKSESLYPVLCSLTLGIEQEEELIIRIQEIIDDKGIIRSSASVRLTEIRNELLRKSQSVNATIAGILRRVRSEGLVEPKTEITVKDGRFVIPVPAANKRKVKGFIHDESASGLTVYIEPTEVFELSNEIRELENAEKREIIRILTEFTNALRPKIDDIFNDLRFLGMIDFIRSKGLTAIQMDGKLPLLSSTPEFEWFNAIHPLLYLNFKATGRTVEPLYIKLTAENRILVISGPNAGGKSVCLKSVGLIQYMLQCGMLVPLSEISQTGLFQSIFLEIGDEQSIENDLSTYSSHLLSLRNLMQHANRFSLFLIDEFGAGTEPQMGGAIAESVLLHLNKKQAYGVVTTHYSNLKMLGESQKGIVNGAMLFDTTLLKPLYKLVMGRPGSSFAFEMAKKSGIPDVILHHAMTLTGRAQLDYEKLLQEVEFKKHEIEQAENRIQKREKQASEIHDKYEQLLKRLDAERKAIIRDAKAEAKRILSESNKLIENTVREIKEAQAGKEETKLARAQLKEKAEEVEKLEIVELQQVEDFKKLPLKKSAVETELKPEEPPLTFDRPPEKGDMVRIYNDSLGEVLEIEGDQALVALGEMKLKIGLDKLTTLNKSLLTDKSDVSKILYGSVMKDLNAKMANFSTTLDVRGQRAEEAIAAVTKYIDEAILLSIKEVSILHGKGNGILRQVIRGQLRQIPEVQSFRDEHIERGGSGITIVILK